MQSQGHLPHCNAVCVIMPSNIQIPATNKNLYIGSFNFTEIQRGQQTFLTRKMLNLCLY